MTDIDKPYIQQKVKAWKKQIANLYTLIEARLFHLDDIRVEKKRYALIHEDLMQQYGVEAENLPILDIYKKDDVTATFKPVGFWVIGASGRVDVETSKGSYILLDKAGHGDKPQWTIYSSKSNEPGEPFTPDIILKMIDIG